MLIIKLNYNKILINITMENTKSNSANFKRHSHMSKYDTAPTGWVGPFINKSLWKSPEGIDYKFIHQKDGIIISGSNFSTFLEAISEAEKLGDECKGVTLTERGYSLRKGELLDGEFLIDSSGDPALGGYASWHKV